MEEKLYQNIDQAQDNPLEIISEKETKKTESKEKTKISLNPKIILLLSLAAIIFVLLLLSIIVTQSRKSSNNTNPIINTTPTSIPISNPDSENSYSLIPSPYQSDFQKINNYTSQDLNLPAPQIDTEIGL